MESMNLAIYQIEREIVTCTEHIKYSTLAIFTVLPWR